MYRPGTAFGTRWGWAWKIELEQVLFKDLQGSGAPQKTEQVPFRDLLGPRRESRSEQVLFKDLQRPGGPQKEEQVPFRDLLESRRESRAAANGVPLKRDVVCLNRRIITDSSL